MAAAVREGSEGRVGVKACKAIGAPIFAAHTVMNEEESVGIELRLDRP